MSKVDNPLAITIIPTAQFIAIGADEYVVVHSRFSDFACSWGMWRRSSQSDYELVLGPLPSYTSRAEGLAKIGVTEWTDIDGDLPTPPNLPLENYTRENLGEYSPPRGSTVQGVLPKWSFRFMIWSALGRRRMPLKFLRR